MIQWLALQARWQRHVAAFFVWLLVSMGVAACIAAEHMAPTPPPPPPPPAILESPLIGTNWRLEQVVYEGAHIVFDAAGPIHLLFDRKGVLTVSSQACGRGNYAITYFGESRYQLANANFLAIDCKGSAWTQFNSVIDALEATEAYELEAPQLTLHGPGAELRFQTETP